jgi:hypothetical protein
VVNVPGRKVVRVYLTPYLAAYLEKEHDITGIGESELLRQAWLFYIKSQKTITRPTRG